MNCSRSASDFKKLTKCENRVLIGRITSRADVCDTPLILLIAFMTALAYLLAIVCLRFRDVTQIVQNSVTVLFFVTPVLWRPEQIAADKAFLLAWNPFAVMMSTIWKPILGQSVPAHDWFVALAYALGACLLATPLIGATRRRLIYWL